MDILPPQKRNFSRGFKKRDKKTHDLWLTEDNIRIPFYIKLPNNQSLTLDSNACSTDILPTFYKLLGVNVNNKYSYAESLFDSKSILDKRIIRVDSRFYGQSDEKKLR